MSEYQEKHSVSRLVGAPPGYVGYDEGGQLTEAVRRKPYSIVLLDEIEKAHPDVFNILLQVLDDGRLTDNKGRLVNFKNTLIIMTSNLGSEIIHQQFEKVNANNLEDVIDATKKRIDEMLRMTIRPEFLNRVDDITLFTPLSKKDVKEIVEIQIELLENKLSTKGIQLFAKDDVIEHIASAGFDPVFGARPIKRLIQKEILNEFSKAILSGTIDKNETVVMDVFNGKIVFRKPISEMEVKRIETIQ